MEKVVTWWVILGIVIDANLFFGVLFTVTEVQKISERVFTRYENC
jgi:hypothetical protein